MPIATVRQLCRPSDAVTSDSLVEQVAQIEEFASGAIDGRAFFKRNHFTAGLERLVRLGFDRLQLGVQIQGGAPTMVGFEPSAFSTIPWPIMCGLVRVNARDEIC